MKKPEEKELPTRTWDLLELSTRAGTLLGIPEGAPT